MPANLSCHPHAIVIRAFIRLCTEKKIKKGGWWVGGGAARTGSGRWDDMKKRTKLKSERTKLSTHTIFCAAEEKRKKKKRGLL